MDMLVNSGKKCIFDHSENLFKYPNEDEIMGLCSAISCCSTYLATQTEIYLNKINISKNIYVIRDAIETDRSIIKKVGTSNRAVIMGSVENVDNVSNVLLESCREAGYDFVTISGIDYNKKYETRKWTPYTWVDDMLTCDVALCYNNPVQFPAKSNVKVTTAMALGIPVIANTLESYMEAIRHDYDGYIAEKREDRVKYLKMLKSPELRATIGLRAQNSAFEKYSLQKICLDYFSMISSIF